MSADIFVDTDVLLAATTPARAEHAAAKAFLESGAALVSSGQVVREYIAVGTRPPESNGLGLRLP